MIYRMSALYTVAPILVVIVISAAALLALSQVNPPPETALTRVRQDLIVRINALESRIKALEARFGVSGNDGSHGNAVQPGHTAPAGTLPYANPEKISVYSVDSAAGTIRCRSCEWIEEK